MPGPVLPGWHRRGTSCFANFWVPDVKNPMRFSCAFCVSLSALAFHTKMVPPRSRRWAAAVICAKTAVLGLRLYGPYGSEGVDFVDFVSKRLTQLALVFGTRLTRMGSSLIVACMVVDSPFVLLLAMGC